MVGKPQLCLMTEVRRRSGPSPAVGRRDVGVIITVQAAVAEAGGGSVWVFALAVVVVAETAVAGLSNLL